MSVHLRAAAALVQQTTANQSFGTSQTALLNGVASGSLLTLAFRERDNGAVSSVSDDVNGAWTLGVVTGNGTDGQCGIYYKANSASGNITVTLNFGANRVFDMNFAEWSGVGTGAADATNSSANASGTSHSSGSVTPSAASLMLSVFSFSNTHGGITGTSGYTALTINGSAANQRQYYQYKVTHTGAETATVTSVTSRSSRGCHAAFLESGGGGGGGGANTRLLLGVGDAF